MSEQETSDTRLAIAAWGFVAAQFALIAVMVIGPRDAGFEVGGGVRGAALVPMLGGLILALWAARHLGKGLTASPLPNGSTDLVSAGPYKLVRHPMYSAVMLFMAGVAVRAGSWRVVVALIALLTLFNVKARWEEQRLAETFPGYDEYMLSTPRFVPRSRSA